MAAKAAASQAKTAERDFIARHRPWISVEVEANSDLRIEPDHSIILYPKLVFRNHGSSPATNIRFDAINTSGCLEDIANVQQMLHDKIALKEIVDGGFTVFPGSNAERCEPSSTLSRSVSEPLGFGNYPLFVGVVIYKFASGETGVTWFSLIIAKKNGGRNIIGGVGMGIGATDIEVPKDNIVFHPTWIGNRAE